MPHKLYAIRHDILTAIEEIKGFVEGRSLSELLVDRTFQLVLERKFEILGEAMNRLRSIAPVAFDGIPSGHRIIGMRNILAHGYDRVDYSVLWAAANEELESLRIHVDSICPE